MKTTLCASGLAAASLLAACASAPPGAPAPAALVPAGERLVGQVAARGVQIYECRAKKDSPGTEWAFVAPEADLVDMQGKPAGKHYAGPHWEANDGSKIVGTVKARADATQAGAIPWLLLSAKSVGGEGAFSKVTSVQRIHTVGGAAPSSGCDAAALGKSVRVPYTADYLWFSP
jgi:hypothetical protein